MCNCVYPDKCTCPKVAKLYKITTTAVATEEYVVVADTEDEAKENLSRGEWEHYHDLGHDDVEVIKVEVLL